MVISKVAKRYAQGLLDFSLDSGTTEQLAEDMKVVQKTISDSTDLKRFFNTPFIDSKKKASVASQIFSSLSDAAKNLILLVIKNGRESDLANIASAYIEKVNERKGVQNVTLTLAANLSSEAVEKIISSTSLVDDSKPKNVKITINPEIIGGYILRVGDQQIDASVKTNLENLKKSMAHA